VRVANQRRAGKDATGQRCMMRWCGKMENQRYQIKRDIKNHLFLSRIAIFLFNKIVNRIIRINNSKNK
jgi:hypothetical protein